MAIKLVIKKTHCPTCKRLVKGLQEKSGSQFKLNCPRCSRLLWTHDGHAWRYA